MTSNEIIKLINVLIGSVEPVCDSAIDYKILNNLKTLIDITNWCLENINTARLSGMDRIEYSAHEIGFTAQLALDEYRNWIGELLNDE